MPRNQHQNQMFIDSVDLVHHFHNLGVVNFFVSFRAMRQLSESLSITLFDCSEVLVMLMAVLIASALALNFKNGLFNRIFLILVGVTTAHPTFPSIFVRIYLGVVRVVRIQGCFQFSSYS
jgi:hypothetical protein